MPIDATCDKGKPGMPRKRFFRARAHSNPLSDSLFPVPVRPGQFDWGTVFPEKEPLGEGGGQTTSEALADDKVRFLDIGCGFGGLLVTLSPMFPNTRILGMELRDKVSEYVRARIEGLRQRHPGEFRNIGVVRTNAMKYLPNFFERGQLTKLFFLFPDPHFKEKNHRRRIISTGLLAEYAFLLAPRGLLYTVTDVEELHIWMVACLDDHPLFERCGPDALAQDPVANILLTATEEGQKVQRNSGQTFLAVFKRV